jgi:hypothetical protein
MKMADTGSLEGGMNARELQEGFFHRRALGAVSLLLALYSLTSCQGDGAKDIRDYYFPLKQLEEGLVYEYQPVYPDSLTSAYWYYRSFIGEDGVFLTGTYYDSRLIPLQLVREELVSNGMLLQELFLYEPDTVGQQRRATAEVLAGNVFPFAVRDSSILYLYKVRWNPPASPDASITLIKNRHYLGDTTIQYQGKKYPAVRFALRESLEHEQDGLFEQSYRGREVYAKGLGLVYYEKHVTDEFRWAYRLADRYPMSQLEDTFRQQIDQKTQE